MVKTKTELFEPEIRHCAELFKALAHSARIAISKYLAETRTCINGAISEELFLFQQLKNKIFRNENYTSKVDPHVS